MEMSDEIYSRSTYLCVISVPTISCISTWIFIHRDGVGKEFEQVKISVGAGCFETY